MARSPLETTALNEIVRHDVRASAILDHYNLDYCCGGALSLAEGCRRRGVDVEQVVAEIEKLNPAPEMTPPEHDPVALVGHIVARHHGYLRDALPRIHQHLARVVAAHGIRHPELSTIESEFCTMSQQLAQHMMKEEAVLFPYIISLAEAVQCQGPQPPDIFGTVQNPVRMMEIEHQEAGNGMVAIRRLSRDYAIPADACSTYRLVMEELEAFERDLQRHVGLEDNLLFPKAVELEEQARVAARDRSRW